MKITIKIDTGNDAFIDDKMTEVDRLIEVATSKIRSGHRDGILQDINGNSVGNYKVTGQ